MEKTLGNCEVLMLIKLVSLVRGFFERQHECEVWEGVGRYTDCCRFLVSQAVSVVGSTVLFDAHACGPHSWTEAILELSDLLHSGHKEITVS